MKRITTHVKSSAVGYVALFFALSAGAYAAGLAPDSVKSRHIQDGQVRSADVADDDSPSALTGADIANESLSNSDVANESLSGSDIATGSLFGSELADNTVTGADVHEPSLGEVPRATIAGHGGYGRQSGGPEEGSQCNPEDEIYITCAEVVMAPSAPARFLLTARVTGRRFDPNRADEAVGTCRLGSNTQGGIPGTTVRHSRTGSDSDWISWSAVTSVYQPGTYTFGIDCNEADLDRNDVWFTGARLTAVAISPF